VLKPGQPVFVPPKEILAEKFPEAVKSTHSIPVAPPITVKPSVVAKTPGASGPDVSPPTTPGVPVKTTEAPAQGVVKQTAAGPVYLVKGNGEMVIEIAKKLGVNWSLIYRLNPQIDPRYPLPPGTQLRLPDSKTVP
jgi:hypothetical protein